MQFKVRYNDDDEVTGGTESLTSAIKSFSITQKSRATKDSSFTYTKKEIRDSTVILLRTLITLGQTMKPLPASRFLTIKLLYRDDITPLEFEPPYFTAADERGTYFYRCCLPFFKFLPISIWLIVLSTCLYM